MSAKQAENRVREVAKLRHMALSTEDSYISWLRRYCHFLPTLSEDLPPAKKVESFLTWMAQQSFSASSQNQAFAALIFFYRNCLEVDLGKVDALRARRPDRLRYCPTREEVETLLRNVTDTGSYPTRLVVHLLYGCGLRVSEPIALRLKDIDLTNSRLTIRCSKGQKDRVVPLPCSLVDPIRKQMAVAAAVSQVDVSAGLPVQIPDRLDIKYPRLSFSPHWAFLFPLKASCKHPRTGATVRFHMLDTTVQRAVRAVVSKFGLNPMITPHCLRHAFATHTMERGGNVRDVQVVMGHSSLETTMGYLHPEVGRIVSPIESMKL